MKDTKKSLDAAVSVVEDARATLQKAEAEHVAAKLAYAETFSDEDEARVATAEEKIAKAKRALDALKTRADRARAEHESAVRAAKAKRLAELKSGPLSEDKLREKLSPLIREFIVADRHLAKTIDSIRAVTLEQRAAAEEALALCVELGQPAGHELAELATDTVRVATAVAIHEDREARGRDAALVHLFLTPIDHQPKFGEIIELRLALADEQTYRSALVLLSPMKKEIANVA